MKYSHILTLTGALLAGGGLSISSPETAKAQPSKTVDNLPQILSFFDLAAKKYNPLRIDACHIHTHGAATTALRLTMQMYPETDENRFDVMPQDKFEQHFKDIDKRLQKAFAECGDLQELRPMEMNRLNVVSANYHNKSIDYHNAFQLPAPKTAPSP